MCRFSALIGWNLSLRFAAVRRPTRTGDAWIELRIRVYAAGWNLSPGSAAVSKQGAQGHVRTGNKIKWYMIVFPGARVTYYMAKPMQLEQGTI
jgi:hypothetical protein